MRGLNDFNLKKQRNTLHGWVSVPMRGLNDFNIQTFAHQCIRRVSVPMRGLNDFNQSEENQMKKINLCFRPHAGFK